MKYRGFSLIPLLLSAPAWSYLDVATQAPAVEFEKNMDEIPQSHRTLSIELDANQLSALGIRIKLAALQETVASTTKVNTTLENVEIRAYSSQEGLQQVNFTSVQSDQPETIETKTTYLQHIESLARTGAKAVYNPDSRTLTLIHPNGQVTINEPVIPDHATSDETDTPVIFLEDNIGLLSQAAEHLQTRETETVLRGTLLEVAPNQYTFTGDPDWFPHYYPGPAIQWSDGKRCYLLGPEFELVLLANGKRQLRRIGDPDWGYEPEDTKNGKKEDKKGKEEGSPSSEKKTKTTTTTTTTSPTKTTATSGQKGNKGTGGDKPPRKNQTPWKNLPADAVINADEEQAKAQQKVDKLSEEMGALKKEKIALKKERKDSKQPKGDREKELEEQINEKQQELDDAENELDYWKRKSPRQWRTPPKKMSPAKTKSSKEERYEEAEREYYEAERLKSDLENKLEAVKNQIEEKSEEDSAPPQASAIGPDPYSLAGLSLDELQDLQEEIEIEIGQIEINMESLNTELNDLDEDLLEESLFSTGPLASDEVTHRNPTEGKGREHKGSKKFHRQAGKKEHEEKVRINAHSSDPVLQLGWHGSNRNPKKASYDKPVYLEDDETKPDDETKED